MDYNKLIYNSENSSYSVNQNDKEILFTGFAYSFLSTGEDGLYNEKFSFTNGKLDGKYISFYENEKGAIKTTGFYLNGKKDGTFITYDPNGKIISKTKYVKGQKK